MTDTFLDFKFWQKPLPGNDHNDGFLSQTDNVRSFKCCMIMIHSVEIFTVMSVWMRLNCKVKATPERWNWELCIPDKFLWRPVHIMYDCHIMIYGCILMVNTNFRNISVIIDMFWHFEKRFNVSVFWLLF